MTTSAYKYKHYSDYAPEVEIYGHYQEPNHQQMVVRSAGNEQNRMNVRSISVNSPTQYYVHDRRRVSSRIEETTPRTENGTFRILNTFSNRYPSVISRRGQIDEAPNDRVVFPGPISPGRPTSRQFVPEVSDDCKRIGFCEDLPNYPEEHVSKIIDSLGDDVNKLQKDELDIPDTPDIAQRLGPSEDNMELCGFRERIVSPKAAPDKDDKWYVVINRSNKPVQSFRVEICDSFERPCADFASFQTGYEARCVQKYFRRTMAVLDENGQMTEKPLKLPSCCSCVARVIL